MTPALVASTATGALIGAGAALLGSAIGFLAYWLGRQIPAEVSAFATEAAGTLDGIRQALAGLEEDAEDAGKRASNVTVYLSGTERLLGSARLQLTGTGEEAADRFIVALRECEQQLRRGAADPAATAYEQALEQQRAFARAARKSRR